MIKNYLFKKIAVLAMVGTMSLSLVACGDEKKSEDKSDIRKTEATTEEITEEETTEEITEEITEEETTEELTEEETTEAEIMSEDDMAGQDGIATASGFSYGVPEGFVYDEASSTSSYLSYLNNDTQTAFIVSIDDANVLGKADAIGAFDAQIKSVFGAHSTSSTVNCNGYEATEWVTDATDGSYSSRSLVVCEGNYLVYIEYVSYTHDLNPFPVIKDGIGF